MRSHLLMLALACAALAWGLTPVTRAHAQARDASALAGHVTSAEEGPMEGVLVSAKKNASTITITVVTDRDGRYAFPASRLEPGEYTLRIRAAGYDLDRAAAATVAANAAATVDLRLVKT